MSRRIAAIRVLVWGPSVIEVACGLLVSALGHVDTWEMSAPNTYAGASIAVWPAGLVLLGAGALGCIVAGLFEAVILARR